MEFLVDMTTRVPEGTTDNAIDDMRAREATRAVELAQDGALRRLWRPPLQPGEWRALGLFEADDADHLAAALASMPLRIWRADQVTELYAHPNDPGPPAPVGAQEFLIAMTVTVPTGTSADMVDDVIAREGKSARDLASRHHLLRLWGLHSDDDSWRVLGLWAGLDQQQMADVVATLPMYPWMRSVITPLSVHPNDPPNRK